MPGTFEILKKRWPEVAVIIALATIPQFLFGMAMRTILSKAGVEYGFAQSANYLHSVLWLIVAVILMIIGAGFLRTAYLHGTESHRIPTLLRKGKHFFWRLLVFSMIWGLIYMLLPMVIIGMRARYMTRTDLATIMPWINTFCMIAVTVAFMKLVLLVPALVIVRDIGLIHAVKSIREYKLFSAKELLILFGIQQAQRFVCILLMPLREINEIFDRSMSLAINIVGYFLVIAIALSAVRFVAEKSLPIETAKQNEINSA